MAEARNPRWPQPQEMKNPPNHHQLAKLVLSPMPTRGLGVEKSRESAKALSEKMLLAKNCAGAGFEKEQRVRELQLELLYEEDDSQISFESAGVPEVLFFDEPFRVLSRAMIIPPRGKRNLEVRHRHCTMGAWGNHPIPRNTHSLAQPCSWKTCRP